MTDTFRPKFTVIIPTYNRAHLIKRAVDSVLNQTFIDFELLVVDDGSKDNTCDILSRYSDNRLHYHQHEINKGQNAARNTGLTFAKSDCIAFLDSDDEWLPEMLEQVNKKYSSDPEISCVYTLVGYKNKSGQINPGRYDYLEGNIYKEALKQGYLSPTITLSAKKKCFIEVGGWDPDFNICDDDDICFRLAKSYKFGLVPEILAVIHFDSGNQTIVNKYNYAEGWMKLYEKFKDDIESYCGKSILSKAFRKVGYLYFIAHEKNKARIYLRKSLKLNFTGKTYIFILLTYLPSKIVTPLFPSRRSIRNFLKFLGLENVVVKYYFKLRQTW